MTKTQTQRQIDALRTRRVQLERALREAEDAVLAEIERNERLEALR